MKSKSFRNTTIIYITVTVCIVTVLATLLYSYFDYKNKKRVFKKELAKIMEISYPVYKKYLWEFDTASLRHFSDSLLNIHPQLCDILIKNEFNDIIYKKSNRKSYCNNGNRYTIKKIFFRQGKFIGSLKVSASISYFRKSFEKIFFLNILIAITVSIFILLVIGFIFKKFFTLPMSNLIENLNKISEGNYNVKFENTGLKDFDEIVSVLNFMIVEIKTREKQNRELTSRLHTLVNNIPEGFLILKKNGDYEEINDSFANMLKMDKKEVLSKKISEYSSPKYSTKFGFAKIEEIESRGYSEFEWEIIDKNGKKIPVFVKGKKITLNKDDYIVFSITDVTYIKNLEKELTKKEKLESLAILAGGIAHDFNNILTSLVSGIDLSKLLISKQQYNNAMKRLEKVLSGIEKAKSLTYQLLTFSKGGAPVKKTFLNLKDLIKDTVSFLLTGSGINVKYEFDKNLKAVKIDPDQISQVIQNIVLNAKQALSNEGVIEIKAVNSLDMVKISIKDYGSGIPEEVLGKIWDPYFSTKTQGSGLGLSIVYSIIKNHDGDIKVYSKPGSFTEFQIFLPALEEFDTKDVCNNKKESYDENIGKLEILIMDDDENIREILKELLEMLGNNVETANNGEEAVKKYKEKKFDIVILDLTVKGGMGGKECIKKLREIDENVRAVVYSGYSNDPVMTNYSEYGFKGILKKPFKMEDMRNIIRECMLK